MLAAAEELRFEYAAKLRDEIRDLKRELDQAIAEGTRPAGRRRRPRRASPVGTLRALLRP